ncbi:MAG: iron-sulfur cluster assembly accessory protein [Pseudomonadales bacterium]|nr:iron-sulfur cluster assembly accessory protein [Pseudomonadales bacterium]MCP5184809.1 iron-sulfur cluster assembly accessory protein [Pseudomonadales bacterium]
MSVATFDPYTVDVTREAAAHLRAQLAAHGGGTLRLGVKESGCNGYSYTLDYTDTTATSDIVVQVDDTLAIHIAEADLPLVRGTRVDYVRDGLNATLQFKNARATSYCGCGESFAIEN